MAHSRGRPRGCSLTTTVRTDRDQRARRTPRAMFERSASTLAFDRGRFGVVVEARNGKHGQLACWRMSPRLAGTGNILYILNIVGNHWLVEWVGARTIWPSRQER